MEIHPRGADEPSLPQGQHVSGDTDADLVRRGDVSNSPADCAPVVHTGPIPCTRIPSVRGVARAWGVLFILFRLRRSLDGASSSRAKTSFESRTNRQAGNKPTKRTFIVSIHETNTRRIHGVQQPSRLESIFVRFASRVVVPTYRWCVRFFRGVGVTQHS